MAYTTDKIRNVALLGHSGSGKTSLAESILYSTGAIDRQGKVADGNTVSDYDSEEIKRQISISLSAMYAEYKQHKINIIDTPGYFDFAGEVAEALRVADIGLIVCSAKDGITVGLEKAWKSLSDHALPRAIYISKIDEENGSFEAVYDALHQKYGTHVCPVVMPIKDAGGKIEGIVDLIRRKTFKVETGKRVEIPVPDSMADELETYYTNINESVAESSEELMEKYFSGEAFTVEEIISGLRSGVQDGSLVPVFGGSAALNLGTLPLLDAIIDLFPSPLGRKEKTADGEAFTVDPNAPACAFVYKTISDQYGKFSLFKVMAGKVTADMTLTNARTGGTEKMGHIYMMQGKKSIEVKELVCGDLGAVSKLSETKTGDTLCDAKKVFAVEGITFPEPCYSMAIAPKTKGQEEKISSGLARLSEEDQTFRYANNVETRQLVISGLGDIHLDVICSKLKDKFGVEVVLSPARVAYREKIRKKVQVRGRHKKQTGGHGQYGDVVIVFEPGESEDLEFAESVFGGAVPKNFFPAVEKGLRESIQKGVLAGYPVVNLKATLIDGSYHPVDSSEMAFKIAAQLAYKEGIPQANPVILEPIGYLTVTVPDANTGDIMSDLSKRRGSPMGMSLNSDGMQVIEAEVPMGEMGNYALDLRSMTQGRGSFTLKFVRYEEAPPNVQQKIIEEAKALSEE